VWTFHHALLDGRCFPVLLREVFEAYSELEKGDVAPRPAAPPYRSYIEWLQCNDGAGAEAFWKALLQGFSAATPLVIERQRPAEPTVYHAGEAWEVLEGALTDRLGKLAEEQGLTLNSLVMGAWAVLLHRYSGEEDILFGATRACRKSSVPDADQMIGLFINTVPVRARLDGETPFLEVWKALRQQWVMMRPYEHAPLVRVKALSQVPPSQPLFETLLVFENYGLDVAMRGLGGAWATRQVELHELTNVPITLAAYAGERLTFKIEFDRRRLDDNAIGRLLGHLRNLLEGIAANPRATVRDLPLLSQEERRDLVEGFNAAAAPCAHRLPINGGATLHELFEAQAARRSDTVALVCDGESLTYGQLNAAANRLAHRLRQCGVKPNTLVGLCLERSNQLVIALLAILKAGGAYLPIDLAYPADRLAFMLEDAQAPVLLTQRKFAGELPSTCAKVLCVEDTLAEPAQTGEEANPSPVAGPDHLAYVIYTSGTTGKPKGSLITHRNVVRLFPATESWFGFNQQDVWTLFHSCAFDFSVWEIWGALLYGGRLVVVPYLVSRSPEAFYELLANEQVTVLNQTPSAFRQLIQAEESVGQRDLALRYVIFGGEALEMQSLRPWFERHGDQRPQLVNMYGITETTVHVTYRPLSQDDLISGSVIGKPIPDLQVYILDGRRQPVPIGVPGEMYVGGAGLARGYLNRPELTAERFVADHLSGRPESRLYKTGDLARFLPDRDIEYLGRIDHQVKIRGFRIELGEIESVLCQHPAVRGAMVLARVDAPGIKRLVGYVVATPAPAVTELREHLLKKLPEYMVPASFVFLEKFPLTNNGKIDRRALPEPEADRPELAEAFVAPRTELETKLARIWSQVLRVERVGIHDNFFELGGDSILSIQIISLARQAGVGISPKLLFQHPTIAELAAAAAASAIALPKAEQGLVEGTAPLTPIQRWFFEQELAQSHHYNQAFLFTVQDPLNLKALARALARLEQHHDALRLRFAATTHPDGQTFAAPSPSVPLEQVDLSAVTDHQLTGCIETNGLRAQASLNFTQGPLWRAVYFDCGSQRPARLLLAIHHLAVDGVSWRILVEDLERAYEGERDGHPAQLPSKTSSVKEWAERLAAMVRRGEVPGGVQYWHQLAAESKNSLPVELDGGENTEASARTVKVHLETAETEALLQRAPAAYNTQINDLLLAALSQTLRPWIDAEGFEVSLEGHGREDLFPGVDLSRTVGWFTTIYPARVRFANGGTGELIKSVKEQLRSVPARGFGYGLQRYLAADQRLVAGPEPQILFNYLGQFDQVTGGSKLFRFASEPIGPWHSPRARRRHLLEINSLVINGRLELWWTYSQNRHRSQTIETLAHRFIFQLRQLVEHCTTLDIRSATPSDFPLAVMDQQTLDALLARVPDLEDVYRLSPIQTLFYTAGANDSRAVLDHWHGTLTGPLELENFQRAWELIAQRHPILRTSFQSAGLKEPVQVVHRLTTLPWRCEDWRGVRADEQAGRWSEFLQADRAQGMALDQAPLMRLAVIRLEEQRFKFLWTVPALLLDGWSWPLVFRDLSRAYEALCRRQPVALEPARPYRDYLAWLRQQSDAETEQYWRAALRGVTAPTQLVAEAPQTPTLRDEQRAEWRMSLDGPIPDRLVTLARQLQVTPNTLFQAAWAMVLARLSGRTDVVFGAAFAGRPGDLRGSEGIVGPFVNNLPVRVTVDAALSVRSFLQGLHDGLLRLNPHQFASLAQIQSWTDVPWRHRLFDSIVVVQNYLVDEAARRLGNAVAISDFVGPIHTSFPLLVLVEPESAWRITLVYDPRELPASAIQRWGKDLVHTLTGLSENTETKVGTLLGQLSLPVTAAPARRGWRVQSQNYVAPQTELERRIAGVWEEMLQLDRISVEENVFDLGVHSLLAVRLHQRLCEVLGRDFSLVSMFQYPTIQSLAKLLSQKVGGDRSGEIRNRAQLQRGAVARSRPVSARR
jgi:amino acid adenylation domain-containing protein/non-ribosomal peptide synthase protein (TIGR01720 family)